MIALSEPTHDVSFALIRDFIRFGIANAATIAMIASTIINSTNVKPRLRVLISLSSYRTVQYRPKNTSGRELLDFR